jgi:hypothetical protein
MPTFRPELSVQVNLQLAPFNFAPPLKLIMEKEPEQQELYFGKSLGLWKLEEL